MKRNFLVIGMGLVLVLSLASVASAVLNFTSVGELCTSIGDVVGTVSVSHDTCVVCLNKGNNGQVCVCKLFEDTGILAALGFTSFGDCVQTFAKDGK